MIRIVLKYLRRRGTLAHSTSVYVSSAVVTVLVALTVGILQLRQESTWTCGDGVDAPLATPLPQHEAYLTDQPSRPPIRIKVSLEQCGVQVRGHAFTPEAGPVSFHGKLEGRLLQLHYMFLASKRRGDATLIRKSEILTGIFWGIGGVSGQRTLGSITIR